MGKNTIFQVFVKTMTLCVVLCNLHGLVFLPGILITIDSLRGLCKPKVRLELPNKDRQTPF